MQLLTPFDLVDMFPEHGSMVLVGNAPSLRGEGLGEWIDNHDVVVRFNDAGIKGYEDDVGRRTDILVTNPYPEDKARPPLDGGGCRLVLVIAPLTRRGDRTEFERWIGNQKVLMTYKPDPTTAITSPRVGGLTTGVSALVLLRRVLKPKRVGLTGFTMFLDDTAVKYWSDDEVPGAAAHDMSSNANALIDLINATPGIMTITQEIAWMARRVERKLNPRVKVRPLIQEKWSVEPS